VQDDLKGIKGREAKRIGLWVEETSDKLEQGRHCAIANARANVAEKIITALGPGITCGRLWAFGAR
jgi:hypothetical protein